MLQKKIHFKFIKSILKGDDVACNYDTRDTTFPKKIFLHDRKDVIWFFNDIFCHLHPLLKGKQILVGHGLGFKKRLNKQRVDTINQYIDLVFQTGVTHDQECIKNGVIINKIRKIGLTLLFEIPKLPTRPNSILFSQTAWHPWRYLVTFIDILRKLDDRIDGYLTIHPQLGKTIQNLLMEICKQKKNLTLIRTQEELLKAYAYCQYYAGGISSTATPFWYLQKPVIFITDYKKSQLNKLKIAKYTNYPSLFYKVLNESSIFYTGMKFNVDFMKNAKISRSVKKIFYPSNFDKTLTVKLITETISEIAKKNIR
jgi:hypothetical protein